MARYAYYVLFVSISIILLFYFAGEYYYSRKLGVRPFFENANNPKGKGVVEFVGQNETIYLHLSDRLFQDGFIMIVDNSKKNQYEIYRLVKD